MSSPQKLTNNIQVPNTDLAVLKKHFAHCFNKNGLFEIEKFTQNLAEQEVNFSRESYGLDWLGKSYARLIAADAATTLLQPNTTHNQLPQNGNSQNLLIKGDNLEVLKHLASAYHQKVKMIYIDPPYNTGSDGFVYADDRKFTVQELQQLAGVEEEKAKRILNFTKANSNSHSAWLTFMYPRLYIAKQLLTDDGVIFISIDDNEVAQLKLLLDEIFGEENFVGQWNWFKSATPPNLSKKIKKNLEYIFCYQKGNNEEYFEGLKKGSSTDDGITKPNNTLKVLTFKPYELNTTLQDGTYNTGIYGTEKYPNELLNNLIVKDGKNVNEVLFKNTFTWTQPKLLEEIKNKTVINLSSNLVLSIKKADYKPEVPPNLIDKNVNVDTTENAGRYLTEIFGQEKIFNYPKPISLLNYLLKFCKTKNELILDFFAGSGTTADAVMQLNAEDGGNRNYILVQLPELIDPKKNKAAYDFVTNELKAEPTIFEITKERLLRAAKKTATTIATNIAQKQTEISALAGKLAVVENAEKTTQLKAQIKALNQQDFGFKIFETTPIWADYDINITEFNNQTELFDESKLTPTDIQALLTTWALSDGLALTQPLQTIELDTYICHYGNSKLYLMYKGFTTNNLITLLQKIDADANFNPTTIIAFGYNFDSKNLRELSENLQSYGNKKKSDIDFITRY